ncbi:MAG: hypothetical protein S4CHLAM102_10440 [Chlamydiia bacterium]|nr:hypothetical protein [Chlamydiia bacterium]
MTFLYFFFIFSFVALCMLLILVVLMQDSKSSGISSLSFNQDSASSVFGTSTADVLKKFTGYLAAIFLGMSLLLSIWSSSINHAKAKRVVPTIEEQVELGE